MKSWNTFERILPEKPPVVISMLLSDYFFFELDLYF